VKGLTVIHTCWYYIHLLHANLSDFGLLGAKFPKMGDFIPRMSMNLCAKFDATSFIFYPCKGCSIGCIHQTWHMNVFAASDIFDALVVEVVKRPQVQLLVGEWSLKTLASCSHCFVSLSSSSIIWYWSMTAMLCHWEGNRRSDITLAVC